MKTILNRKSLATIFHENVEDLSGFIHFVHQFTINLMDESKEEFVKSELDRNSFI